MNRVNKIIAEFKEKKKWGRNLFVLEIVMSIMFIVGSYMKWVDFVYCYFVGVLTIFILSLILFIGKWIDEKREKDLNSEKRSDDDRIFNVLATIFTVTSISFSFLEISGAPIRWEYILLGAIIFSAILIWVYKSQNCTAYTITAIGISILFLSMILVLPRTYYYYYSNQLVEISNISSKTEHDNYGDNTVEHFREIDRLEKESRINILLSDPYFVKNYKDGLLKKAHTELRHMKLYENQENDSFIGGIGISSPSTKILSPFKNVVEYNISVFFEDENAKFRTDDIMNCITVVGCDNYKLAYEKVVEGKLRLLIRIDGGHTSRAYVQVRDGFVKLGDSMFNRAIDKSESFIYIGWDWYFTIALLAAIGILVMYWYMRERKLSKREQ